MSVLLFDWGGTSIKYGVWNQGTLQSVAAVKTPEDWEDMRTLLVRICRQTQRHFAIKGVSISAPAA